ncbi:MAG: cadherin-like beta sandwich domain-containing protein, partial [Gammaproteobacteria bacterium]
MRWAQGAGSETWINDGGEDGVSAGNNLRYTVSGLTRGERYDVQVGAIVSGSTTPVWSASVGGIVNSGRLTTLALTGPDGQAIALTPAFAPGTENYTASVGQAISSVSVTATTIGGGEFGFSKNQDAFRLLAVLSQTERMASGGAGIPVDLAVGANTLYVASASLPDSSAQVFGGLNPHVLTITRAAITTPAKITPAVTARATALRVNWSAPSGDFAAAYEITWRTAATDGADNMPGTTDDVAAGAWQNASGDDTDCAAAADPGAADDCGEDVGDVRAYT